MTTGPRADSICPLCSRPIRSVGLVLYEHGEMFHITCRRLELPNVESIERARAARAEAARLLEDAEHVRAQVRRYFGSAIACPLCRQPATLVDWRPRMDWVAIEGCPCNGFFVGGRLLDTRLPELPVATRDYFARQVRKFREMGHEVWCTTTDGTVHGPLLLRTERPV